MLAFSGKELCPMSEPDLDFTLPEKPNRLQFKRLLTFAVHPRQMFSEICQSESGAWLVPLLTLSLLILVNVLVAGPIHQSIAQSGANFPADFENYTAEQQQQYLQAQSSAASPVFAYIFPAIGKLTGLWITWLLLGSLLHLALTLAGSRSPNISALNVTAWAMLPLGLRELVQAGYMLFTHHLVNAQGLAGFVDSTTGRLASMGSAILGQVDLYTLGVLALLLLASVALSELPPRKAWGATVIAFFIFLLMASLPAFISSQFSGLSLTQPFFYF